MTAYDSPSLACPAASAPNPEDTPWHAGQPSLILDLDGTLIREHEPIEGAAELLRAFHGRFVIVSNNSTHTAHQMARRLRGMGLPVRAGDLVLAGEQMVQYLRAHHAGARILMRATPALKRQAAARGCRLVERDADVVALALDKTFDYAALAAMARELARGAKLVASNIDRTHPGPDGQIVPETGTLLQAVMACTGNRPRHVCGKPGPAMFAEGLRRLGSTPAATLVIGDNPATDAAGAARAGLRYVLLGTGPQAMAATPAQLLARDCTARSGLPGRGAA
ncbi:HAD-IIA family hydrolase [Bordetella sp. BOR01]|uniref:HAD-IIA family hydrolase n=1 Tax=Bordetella sp. BOR01 TaxID=2854779 RepID=UPI001C438645|nr:HAD-IIA family hydrolase [Bordetella sp. BOR01]MBV7485533.1 HAD-IIA family hydrolase [Bordetella sp. BOR01]